MHKNCLRQLCDLKSVQNEIITFCFILSIKNWYRYCFSFELKRVFFRRVFSHFIFRKTSCFLFQKVEKKLVFFLVFVFLRHCVFLLLFVFIREDDDGSSNESERQKQIDRLVQDHRNQTDILHSFG